MPELRTRGATIHYQKSGSGPAVLLIQGVGCPGAMWQPQIDALASQFTLVSFDNRGIGQSTIDDGEMTIEAFATDALAVMDALKIERFHVAGHSMGGVIAQQLALTAKNRVVSLALLCTFSRGSEALSLRPSLLWASIRTRLGTRAMRRRAFLEMVVPPACSTTEERAALMQTFTRLMGRDLADQPPIVMKQLFALKKHNAFARLKELAGLRTLVASARYDIIAPPAIGQRLASAIPGSTFIEFAYAGHGVPIQRPDEVNTLLREHVSGV